MRNDEKKCVLDNPCDGNSLVGRFFSTFRVFGFFSFLAMGIDKEIFVDCSTVDTLLCHICYNVLLEPVAFNCRHFVCRQCMDRVQVHAHANKVQPSCPYCRTTGQVTPADKLITDIINSLEVKCYFKKEGCTDRIGYLQFDEHLRTCKFRTEPCEYCGVIKIMRDLPLHEIFCAENPNRKSLEGFCACCRNKLLEGLPH